MEAVDREEDLGPYVVSDSEDDDPRDATLSNAVERRNRIYRQPCHDILKLSVCLNSDHHPGTVRWHAILKDFSDKTQEFPVWNDSIATRAMEELAKEDDFQFLVFLDQQHRPCESIEMGTWFVATREEIQEKAREHFSYLRGGSQ